MERDLRCAYNFHNPKQIAKIAKIAKKPPITIPAIADFEYSGFSGFFFRLMQLIKRKVHQKMNKNDQKLAKNSTPPTTEVHYEQKSVSEAIRLSKHAKMALDGKLMMVDVQVQKRKKSSKPVYSLDDSIPLLIHPTIRI